MLDIPPPPRSDSLVHPTTEKGSAATSKSRNPFSSASRLDKPTTASKTDAAAAAAAMTDDLNMYVGPVSDEEEDGGWRLAGSVGGTTLGRRRTFSERGSPRPMSDEHAKTVADGRRSAENITSSSAPNTSTPFKNASTQLTPVREASTGDIDALVAEPSPIEGSAPTSTEQAAAAAANAAGTHSRPAVNRQVTTAASSVEGGTDSTSTREKRAKFDDEKLAKNDEVRRDAEKEKERRGRSGTKASTLWGSVRRSRTVEGTTTTSGAGTKTPPERHVLKKRNSKSDVEKVER